MRLKPALAYKISQVTVITILWVFVGVLVELNNAVNYDPVSHRHFLHFIFGRNALEHFIITAIGALIGGILGGSFIIFYQRKKLKGKTYAQKLLIHSLFYLTFVSICILIVGIIGAFNNPVDQPFWEKFWGDIFSFRVLRLLIDWYIIVIITIFLLDVSERYGSGILKNLLLGRYYAPAKEERIFMFLDLTSSTAMAEKIGDDLYFRMLRYFYEVADEAIVNHLGEIYQYVGDEIIVSWQKEQGLKNANCLHCFTAIREAVAQRSDYFMKNYGVVPQFKAGMHSGEVMTGQIGSVKRDIVYSGDVLNTTSRIVGLCNQYHQTLLISEILYEALKETPGYQFTYLENPLLRGKTLILGLYGVTMTN